MSVIKHAVIAAAGRGTRLGLGCTKCLLEIEKKPLISYLLKLLEDIEDVRIVVGFQEEEVIETVLRYRKDIIFVRNAEYLSTSTITSYWLGARGLTQHTLFMDADILFAPDEFFQFKAQCATAINKNRLAITPAKTNDAVFVTLANNQAITLKQGEKSEWEWANLCFIHPTLLTSSGSSVFSRLATFLPMPVSKLTAYEIDRPDDMKNALNSQIARDPFYN